MERLPKYSLFTTKRELRFYVFFYLCLHQIWRGTGVFLIYMYTYKIKFYNKNNEWRQSQRTV